MVTEAQRYLSPPLHIGPDRTYSLAELIDLAEAHNPETKVAWESARAQVAALGIARSELFPTLVAVALAGVDRSEEGLGSQFYRQTIGTFELSLNLTYTIFDFGARRGRINAESARLLASNFAFNNVHRQLIDDVSQAYYRMLNAQGQEEAAGASLVNARSVQQAAEERLRNCLATLPDVLEARSATAQAEYDLQAVLGASASTRVRVQPLSEVPTPESVSDTVQQAMARALEHRPDLQARVAEVHLAQAERLTGAGRLLSQSEPDSISESAIALSSAADSSLGTHYRFERRPFTEPELDGIRRRGAAKPAGGGRG